MEERNGGRVVGNERNILEEEWSRRKEIDGVEEEKGSRGRAGEWRKKSGGIEEWREMSEGVEEEVWRGRSGGRSLEGEEFERERRGKEVDK